MTAWASWVLAACRAGMGGALVALCLGALFGRAPGPQTVRGQVLGLEPGRAAVIIVSRGDCSDPEREGPRWAQERLAEHGRFEVTLHRASSGAGRICVFQAKTTGAGSDRWAVLQLPERPDPQAFHTIRLGPAPEHAGPRR